MWLEAEGGIGHRIKLVEVKVHKEQAKMKKSIKIIKIKKENNHRGDRKKNTREVSERETDSEYIFRISLVTVIFRPDWEELISWAYPTDNMTYSL